jgi:O-antigen/teichoic acid export membrane protein
MDKTTNNWFSTIFQRVVTKVYRRVFNEDISIEAKDFMKNLLYIGIGTVISAALGTVFMVIGGRLLGPGEYGKFVLIQSVAGFLNLPMLLGFSTGMLKYTSEKQDTERQSNIIITSFMFVLFFTSFSTIIYLVFKSPLSRLFDISGELFYLAIVFAVLYVFYTLATNALRGLDRMRTFSVFQVSYACILILSFFAFIINKHLSFTSMLFPMFFAYGIIIIALIVFMRYIGVISKWKFDAALVKTLIKYGIATFVGGISYVVYTNIDRIMLARYWSTYEVGIYSAYYIGSINVAMLLWGVFNMVFFPTVSKYKNKGPAFKKINKILPYLIGLGIPLLVICEFVVLKLYGTQYKIDLLWLLLFAVTSMCMVIQGLYAWLLNSIGASGAVMASLTALVSAVVNVGLNFILIPRFGISGSIISLFSSYCAALVVVLVFGRKYFIDNKNKN